MARWLGAALLHLMTLSAATAWTPPHHPLLLTPESITRLRRSTDSAVHHIHVHGWHLELEVNRAIRSPFYNECQFYKGRVLNEDDSKATLTECGNQLYGIIQTGGEEFVLQPDKNDGSHVLVRRDVLLAENPVAYNLTGDTVSDLELDLDEDAPAPRPHVRPRHSARADIEEFRGPQIVTRPSSGIQGLWLEMAIIADHTMLKFHGRERVKHYILALMNIVSAIFNDRSLGSNITLVINKLFLYEEKDPVIKYGNVKKTLEAVNKWNYRHLMKLPAESTGWDAAVWLTRAPLGGPSGYAPVGGVCSRTRSAAIDRDEGLTSAFVIAHELGHLLGLTHDGENQCQTDALRRSVMSPTVLATLHNYTWSKCSKEQFHEKYYLSSAISHWRSGSELEARRVRSELAMLYTQYVSVQHTQRTRCVLAAGPCVLASLPTRFQIASVIWLKWWCLHSRSHDEGVELGGARELSHYVFSMDEQCRTEFGEGFSVCKSVKVRSACSRLWCAHRAQPHVCRSKRAPPLEGTPCAHDRWCVNRVCEPMPGRESEAVEEPVAAPEWSDWSPWGDCTADCGYGVRVRKRHCRYKKSVSEKGCEGAGSQIATCWSGAACAATRDARADICLRQDRRMIPHIHPDDAKACEVWCMDYEGGAPSTFGSLPDGTPCSYERQYDVCFQGTCVKGHCNSSDPVCNWCPDGYCNNNTHYYTRLLSKDWARMAVIPHEAHRISVHISTPLALHIAIRERKRDRHILKLSKHHSRRFEVEQDNYLRYDPNVPQNLQIVEVDSNVIDIKEDTRGWEGSAVAAGTLLNWKQTDSDVYITATSRLQTDLMVMAIPENTVALEAPVTVAVAVNYSTPADRTRPLEYRWSTERGPCSASCGGGVRLVRPRCPHDDCPPPRYEQCNTHSCEFVWSADEWEECSATCGDEGVQERQLFCVPANMSISSRRDLIRNSVSPALCTGPKPEKQQACNRLPCPVYWQEMPWTQCSASCGRGVSTRPLACPASDAMLCGPKPRERRRRCRLRRCPRAPVTCTRFDTTQYCELFTQEQLIRNCAVTPFRKYCCNACRNADSMQRGTG